MTVNDRASLTLLQKHAGRRAVGADAYGSVLGCIGLLGFAAVVWATASHWPGWLTLAAAMISWSILCLGVPLGTAPCAPETCVNPDGVGRFSPALQPFD
ncbi:MAG TPA: hypothetical protein VNL35_06030 [Chloroflexota bacterium]|nr:hypothetical protein [Chloroflexota bacterium]